MIPEIYQEIEAVTDRETARKLAELFAGCQVYFPIWGRSEQQRKRDVAIYRDRMSGVAIYDLVKKYGLTERRIRAIIETRRARQGRLPL
jgi:Mor family transcriptional regulator